jgi:hypothetical protein
LVSDRFRTRQKARATQVTRENGPIAYGTDVFGSESRERADAMLSST